jgi:hypothetical protein
MMNSHIRNGYMEYNGDEKELNELRMLANRVFIRLDVAAKRGELPKMLPMPYIYEQLMLDRNKPVRDGSETTLYRSDAAL